MQRSKTCMCPSGDTPTTRRLYESLASGCVPIRIDSIKDHSLPFSKLVPWKNLTFRINPLKMSLTHRYKKPSSDILDLRLQEAKYIVTNFIKNKNLHTMSEEGRRISSKYMNLFRPKNFIDAILMHW